MGPLSPVGPGFMDFKPPKRRGAMGRVAGRAGSDTVDVSATGPSGVSGRSGVDPSGPPGVSSLLAASVTSASSENDEMQNGSSSVIKRILKSSEKVEICNLKSFSKISRNLPMHSEFLLPHHVHPSTDVWAIPLLLSVLESLSALGGTS